MNARVELDRLLPQLDHSHLDWLEEEAIFVLRELLNTIGEEDFGEKVLVPMILTKPANPI